MRPAPLPLLGLVALAACGGAPPASGEPAGEDPPGSPGACAADREGSVVHLTTEDGVRLEADLHTTGAEGGRAVALFHMIPPSNDRRNYPAAFVEALLDASISVLNVDRRGAGGSEGDPEAAYRGPGGARDVAAAVAFLESHPCAFAPLGLVGASNGTTAILDYTAGAEPAGRPAALVFLTGGSYTENQTSLAAERDALGSLPLLFVYSTEERAWSARFEDGAPPAWTFREYEGGAHGTRMFDAAPRSAAEVVAFLRAHLP